ncbi:ferritin-like domain-containing protein [Sphingobium bisphenolivorans]|uniref:ferritin-like domain-containing protein n=1 Tax=Sphingobium bisphenolivorans TaxID=1335760 RepID=UPI0003AAD997|nr:PA2169 family four-helix-bundle protein [Sphingobium bisphenolivorans]
MSADSTISTLNSLIKTTLDSMKGFKDAAEDAESTQFATLFADFARERSQVATSLQTEVTRLGGNPEDDSSFLAAAHRTFMDLKQAFTGKDDKAIIQEVERGEDYIKGKFEAALNDADLDPSSRSVVEQAFQSVKAGHDRASALKHSLS